MSYRQIDDELSLLPNDIAVYRCDGAPRAFTVIGWANDDGVAVPVLACGVPGVRRGPDAYDLLTSSKLGGVFLSGIREEKAEAR